jgi:hypothetical protein
MSKSPRRARRNPVRRPSPFVTRREFAAFLAIVERNTERINRLEDVFALHVQQRNEVSKALATLKKTLKPGRNER